LVVRRRHRLDDFILSTGWIVDHFSYVPVLVSAGLLAPLGTLVSVRVERPH
jgi:hypothetical protein